MKKVIIFLVLLSCGFQAYALSETEKEQYKKWSLYGYSRGDIGFFDSQDCVSFTNAFTGSGDLLSSLISDDEFRAIIKSPQYTPDYKTKLEDKNMLYIYTPDYIIDLDKLIVKTLKQNFYARSVCHIGKNIDVIVGSKLSDAISGDMILVRKNKEVFILPSSVRIMSQTVTGGDVGYCQEKGNTSNSFTWSCYTKLQ